MSNKFEITPQMIDAAGDRSFAGELSRGCRGLSYSDNQQ
jgi:hypothetical protein